MTQKVNVTTIAMYMNFGDYSKWVIDTYARFNPKKNFIENFMKEYSGNGIEKIKVVDEWTNEYPIENMNDYKIMIDHINECFKDMNQTILEYQKRGDNMNGYIDAYYEGCMFGLDHHISDLKRLKEMIEGFMLIDLETKQMILDSIDTKINLCNDRITYINNKWDTNSKQYS